jgi:suppressor of G2 allele of SKP1
MAEPQKESAPGSGNAGADGKEDLTNANEVVVPQPPVEMKVKRDWYQTESDVVLNILAKNIKKEDVTIAFADQGIQVDAKLADGTDYNLKLDLFRPINTNVCSFKVLSTKIEVKMRKLDCSSWTALEAIPGNNDFRPTYPTSSKKKLDWDKLDKQIEKETKDDDQDVNSLFAKIYNSGDENTKKAMIKSMQESGGTVLSTNWEEVGKKPVEVSPPDGMEYRKWDS